MTTTPNSAKGPYEDKKPDYPDRWLSANLEELICELGNREDPGEDGPPDFDIVIVGSGYGGSIAAARLAGRIDKTTNQPVRICVLERGKEYVAGHFPDSEARIPVHIRVNTAGDPEPKGLPEGLFDLRIGPDVSALVANGLGGGSLINAGVMAEAAPEVFQSSEWPQSLRQPGALAAYYREVRKFIAPTRDGAFAGVVPQSAPLKFKALRELARNARDARFSAAQLSLSLDGGPNAAGIHLERCKRCGDCATGCNHRAKNSLDQCALAIAARNGAKIVTGATVIRVSRSAQVGWCLHVEHTNALLRRRRSGPFPLRARRVILAAGAFGSTEILMRSQSDGLRFSATLGKKFSTNGDLLAAAYGCKHKVNAVATETTRFETRDIGPTITGIVDMRKGTQGFVIEEFAIPGPLRRLFTESFTTAHLFTRLGKPDPERRHKPGKPKLDPCAVDDELIERTQVFGVMGHDGAKGELELVGDPKASGNGAIAVKWRDGKKAELDAVFEAQVATLEKLVRKSALGGTVLGNPVWRLLPRNLSAIVEMPTGPALTVHPLGGCAMADGKAEGVVDEFGRVFDGATDGVHEGLVVLDGSIVPTSLGINPALTIAAVALRAAEFHAKNWLEESNLSEDVAASAARRFSALPPARKIEPAPHVPTTIKITERVVAKDMCLDGRDQPLVVEMSIAFEPVELDELSRCMGKKVRVDPTESRLRIYAVEDWRDHWELGASDREFAEAAVFTAPLSGEMTLLDRARSTAFRRRCRALVAWWRNRGRRDLYQRLKTSNKPLGNLIEMLTTFFHLASHAGEERQFVYELEIGTPMDQPVDEEAQALAKLLAGKRIRTVKRLTYAHRSNPWRQLSEMHVEEFPGRKRTDRAPVFELEPKFFARQQKHLMQFVEHRDQSTALLDMASFLLYILRLLLSIHIWSFRMPDTDDESVLHQAGDEHDRDEDPQRLPRTIPGIERMETESLPVGTTADGKLIKIKLTRYPREHSTGRPVILIHGFSANGTSFTHHSLRMSLAKYLWDRGRDVWVLDLRTSSGLPRTRGLPWKFEEVACIDIPAAFDHIQTKLAEERSVDKSTVKIDVVAHCMGAAMLSMAILDDGTSIPGGWNQAAFLNSIGRVVLSQVGPMVVFTAANVFRAYAVGYIQQAFGTQTFEFKPQRDLLSQVLDRLLATVPYPEEEFDYENPPEARARTPWVGTRHRIDAWFGRTFNVKNVAPEVLECIDDMFGPINLHTTFQTIQFARNGCICTRDGRNIYVNPAQLGRWRAIPTLCIHGAENGLSDPATLRRMTVLMRAIGHADFEDCRVEGFGHQDCLIGKDAPTKIFPRIGEFLDRPLQQAAMSTASALLPGPNMTPPTAAALGPRERGFLERELFVTKDGRTACAPYLGPIIGKMNGGRKLQIAVGANPKLGEPRSLMVVPVANTGGTWRVVSDSAYTREYRLFRVAASTDRHRLQWFKTAIDVDWPSDLTILLLLRVEQFALLRGDLFAITKNKVSIDGGGGSDSAASDWLDRFVQSFSPSGATTIERLAEEFLRRASERELKAALFQRPVQAPENDSLVFIHASCQYPPGPLDEELATASYNKIDEYLKKCGPEKCPQFLVLNGDQVYVDATAGLMDPTIQDDRYGIPYETYFRLPGVREVLKKLPAYMLPDDHEFQDNWEAVQDPCFVSTWFAARRRTSNINASSARRRIRRCGLRIRSAVTSSFSRTRARSAR